MVGLFLSRCGYVAAQAFRIVRGQIFNQRLVRIVTGHAGEASVAFAPALAAFEPVGGKAGIVDSAVWKITDVPPGAMAASAKVHRRAWVEMHRIEDQTRISAEVCVRGRDVRRSWPVATLARNSRDQVRRIQMSAHIRGCRVAAEALDLLLFGNLASESAVEQIRDARWMIWSDANTEIVEQAYARLLKVSVVTKQEALPAAAAAKHQKHGRGKSLPIAADVVSDSTILFGQFIVERAQVVGDLSSGQGGLRGRSSRVRHRMFCLSRCQCGVTLGTDLRADIIVSRCVAFARPPAGFGEVFLRCELLADGGRNLRGQKRAYKDKENKCPGMSHSERQRRR